MGDGGTILTEVHEKVCPVCGRYVEVFPGELWEIEFHWKRESLRNTLNKCPGTGQRLSEGNSRKTFQLRWIGEKKK